MRRRYFIEMRLLDNLCKTVFLKRLRICQILEVCGRRNKCIKMAFISHIKSPSSCSFFRQSEHF